MRLYIYNKTCNIETNIYHDSLKNQPFLLSNPASEIGRKLNFGDNLKAKKSLMNRILTKTVLLDSKRSLIEAYSAPEFLRGVYHAFVGKSLFIRPN